LGTELFGLMSAIYLAEGIDIHNGRGRSGLKGRQSAKSPRAP